MKDACMSLPYLAVVIFVFLVAHGLKASFLIFLFCPAPIDFHPFFHATTTLPDRHYGTIHCHQSSRIQISFNSKKNDETLTLFGLLPSLSSGLLELTANILAETSAENDNQYILRGEQVMDLDESEEGKEERVQGCDW